MVLVIVITLVSLLGIAIALGVRSAPPEALSPSPGATSAGLLTASLY